MKVDIIFEDWKEEGRSIYHTQEGTNLSMGSLHSGSTWVAEVAFDPDTMLELKNKGKYRAIFEVDPIVGEEITQQDHIAHNERSLIGLDELLVKFIAQNPDKSLSTIGVLDFWKWARAQADISILSGNKGGK